MAGLRIAGLTMLAGLAAATAWHGGAAAQAPQQTGGRQAMQRCMMGQLPEGVASVRAGMRAWRNANPSATEAQRKAERRSLAEGWRASHREEVATARTACGG